MVAFTIATLFWLGCSHHDIESHDASDLAAIPDDGGADVDFGNADLATPRQLSFSLRAARSWPMEGNAACVRLGDLDGDGKIDIVLANYQSRVTVLHNEGGGKFAKPVHYTVSSGTQAVALGDFNHDGKLDVVASGFGGPTNLVSVLLNKGDGTLDAAVDYAIGDNGANPYALVTGDLDGNGSVDIAVANQSAGNLGILLNKGDGTFGTATNVAAGASPSDIAAGDVDGDGNIDLAVANDGDGTVSVFLNSGGGSFAPAVNYAAAAGPSGVALADVDGDGALDLVTANDSGSVSVLHNQGNGTFAAAATQMVPGGHTALAVGNVVGDARPDVVAVGPGGAAVLERGAMAFGVALEAAGASPRSVALADLDGDGKLDAAVANYDSSDVSVFLSDGLRLVGAAQESWTIPAGGAPFGVALLDVDGDGYLDLAAPDEGNGAVLVMHNKGDGTFDTPQSFAVGSAPISITAGDVTGDGKPDLIVGSDAAVRAYVLVNDGHGGFTAATAYRGEACAIRIDDLNGDKLNDFVVADCHTGGVSVYLSLGGGAFQPERYYSTASSPQTMALGDVDGDGKPDVVVATYELLGGPSQVAVLHNNGDGTFGAPTAYATGKDPVAIVVVDLDGDGWRDIATVDLVNGYDDSLSLVMNKGDGTFAAPVSISGLASPKALAAADFVGDGRIDLAATRSGGIDILLNAGKGAFAPAVSYSAGKSNAIAIGDVDGDHLADLVAANSISAALLRNTSH
ncbi:MAG: repeat protein [Myxococcales bacterium]|nr:repeat protein [Myxococcales bacterium]